MKTMKKLNIGILGALFRSAVVVCIESILNAFCVYCWFLLLSEVHTACKFADADEISALNDIVLQW